MRVKFLVLGFLLLFCVRKGYSQCNVTVDKTDVSCNGGNNGSASVNVAGGASNNCVTPPTTTYTCASGCTSTITTNTSDVTVGSGQQVCITMTGFNKGITMNGGTLIICGTATPSSVTFNGGTMIVNGTATFNSVSVSSSTAVLTNYGTINATSSFSIAGTFNNHGVCNITSGNLNDQSPSGVINNTNTITISSGDLNNNGTFVNSGTLTIGGAWYHNPSSSMINNCNITAGSIQSGGTINNNGKITITNAFALNSNTITTQPGSQVICGSFQFNSGSIVAAGSNCSSFKVNGNAIINTGISVTGPVSICVTGTTQNNSGQTISQLNCTCNIGSSTCTYSWSNGATTRSVSNLTAGTYTVNTTCSGCSTVVNTVTIGQPSAALAATATQTNVDCNGNPGSINLTVSGGTSPYTYSWKNGSNQVISTQQNPTGLVAGSYTVTITDSKNCTKQYTYTITQAGSGLTLSIPTPASVCKGGIYGEITLNVTGGTAPFKYTWKNALNVVVDSVQNPKNLPAGTYTVSVKDAGTCTYLATTTIPQFSLSIGVSTTNLNCYNGSNGAIGLTVTGGTAPYNYIWNNGAETASLSNLTAGNYSVVVYDSKMCTDTVNVAISSPAQLVTSTISYNIDARTDTGKVFLTVLGGTPGYSYVWKDTANVQIATTQNLTGVKQGIYTVTITDSKGCVVKTSGTVESSIEGLPTAQIFSVVNINGQSVQYDLDEAYVGAGLFRDVAGDSVNYIERQGSRWFVYGDSLVSDNFLTIELLKKFSAAPDSLAIEAMFHKGSYSFGNSYSQEDGVEISYFDGITLWTTQGNQDGSYFEIEDINIDTEYFNTGGVKKSTGKFACILYDSAGNSMSISDATFSGFMCRH